MMDQFVFLRTETVSKGPLSNFVSSGGTWLPLFVSLLDLTEQFLTTYHHQGRLNSVLFCALCQCYDKHAISVSLLSSVCDSRSYNFIVTIPNMLEHQFPSMHSMVQWDYQYVASVCV